jgi:hypothetical protein
MTISSFDAIGMSNQDHITIATGIPSGNFYYAILGCIYWCANFIGNIQPSMSP